VPRSWYFVAGSASLPSGGHTVVRVAGADLLVFRTQAGQVRVTADACPHMGRRLGDGGRVVGESFECPLHRRRYTVSAGGAQPGMLEGLPVQEVNGLVLAWVAPDRSDPDFVVPAVDRARWTAPVFTTLDLPTTAETIMQDLADEVHFTTVHGYVSITPLEPFLADGATLRVAYAIRRRLGAGPVAVNQHVRFWSRAHGLGYQVTEVESFGGRLRSRHFVLPTPVDGTTTRVTLGLSIRFDGTSRAGSAPHPVAALLRRPVLRSFVHDVGLDARAWANRYPVRPVGDPEEPVLRAFQRWADQFYPSA
jgi:phenylpropionate dioxygenase-like ring-hydroxylating dioxygenase large terminal subunit